MSKDGNLTWTVAGSVFNIYYMNFHLYQMIVPLNLFLPVLDSLVSFVYMKSKR